MKSVGSTISAALKNLLLTFIFIVVSTSTQASGNVTFNLPATDADG